MSFEDDLENELVEKGYTGPRITGEDIDNLIIAEQYHVFNDAKITICCLTLVNGYGVIGDSACAARQDFDEDIGRRIAHAEARAKIWQLEGYRLRQRINDTEE